MPRPYVRRRTVGLLPAVGTERALVLGVAEAIVDRVEPVVACEVVEQAHQDVGADVVVGVGGVVARQAGAEDPWYPKPVQKAQGSSSTSGRRRETSRAPWRPSSG